jgi:protoporphyrinogen oxidase
VRGHLVAAAARDRRPVRRGRARSRQAAAQGLRYRDFLTIALVIDGEDLFPDNWIYIHEPGVQVGRIQNFRSWSPWMVPDQSKASIGMEYFCFKGDELWESSDDGTGRARQREIEKLGSRGAEGRAGFVTRVPKAYPMYDADYGERVEVIRGWLEGITNISRSAATVCTATTTRTTRC